MNTKLIYRIIIITLFVLIMLVIPWEHLQGFKFVDRGNYLEYFNYHTNILEYKRIDNFIGALTNEVLWHYLIPLLTDDLGINIEHIFIVITVFCLFTFSLFLANRHGIWSLLLLINPLLITLSFSQLRMAFAYSFLLTAYMSRKLILAIALTIPAILIHTSSLIFISIFIFIWLLPKVKLKFASDKLQYISACVLAGLILSIAIGPLRDLILGSVGDRRIGYGNISSSLLYTSFWIGMLGLCMIQRTDFYRSEITKYSIIILSLVSFNIFTGGYTLRFLAVALPMLITTMLDMDKFKKYLCIIFYIIYLSFQWVYWLGIKPF